MTELELYEKYKKELCVLCNNKKSTDCNIRIYKDYQNKLLCCKCIYFNSNQNINNEIKCH